ncbi:MAG: class I SAM-dependent rRNA methyltransferase [Anaerolineales bacterium]
MLEYTRVVLKPGREAVVQRRHPWIFSGAVDSIVGDDPPGGGLVAVLQAGGDFLAWGHYSPHSQIRVRLFSWREDAAVESPDFWEARLRRALAARAPLLADPQTTACRLVNAESDGIPGLIVDRYGDVLVIQYLAAGVEARREMLAAAIWRVASEHGLAPATLYERSDVEVREKEGLPLRAGLIRGEPLPDHVEILEHGLRFLVDVRSGHKTGFYLDQRPNRQRLREAVTAWRRAHPAEATGAPALLNVFAYTGGFGIYGIAGGAASVVNIETSADALALGRENLARNDWAASDIAIEDITDDAFEALRALRESGRRFDMIVLDPPKFAASKRDVPSASRGYKDINFQALHLLRPGGLLFTFSCSSAISADLFQKIVFGAALDAGRRTQMIGYLAQGSDHPTALTFPEGSYLKGLICRVVHGCS